MGEKQDSVSLWLGTAPSHKALQEYVCLTYDEDGDVVPSQFMRDFGLELWDSDFQEVALLDEDKTRIRETLEGASYDDQLIPAFEGQVGPTLDFPVNAIVLLYNYHNGSPLVTASKGDVAMCFVGVTEYRH